jgi:uncharacterized protein YecT (DUF1311 family)
MDSHMRLFTTLLFLFIFTAPIASGEVPQKTEACAAAQSQAEMTICWENQYKAADAKLNQVYRQFTAKLDDEEKTQLKTAQTAWLKYRDTNCEFVADQYKGGTMRPMIAAICLTDVTDNRTKELTVQMKEREQ